MPENQPQATRTIHVATDHGDTRISGVDNWQTRDGVLWLYDEDRRLIFLAPFDRIIYMKDLGPDGPASSGVVTTSSGMVQLNRDTGHGLA